MATNKAINSTTSILTVDPGASGDSYIQFSLTGSDSYRIGVDDGSGDSFKVSQGNALGANDHLIITASGEVTQPLQPAFAAYLPSDALNATGDGTTFTIGTGTAWTERFDQNSDFNTNGTFTAPVTGTYMFQANVLLDDKTSSHDAGNMTFNASNRDINTLWNNPYVLGGLSSRFRTFSGSCSIDMDASDTMIFQLTVSGGTKVVDVRGTGGTRWTYFSGWLIG